ncbi:pentatricopeptide repeat-containing protein CRP1 homolog, chloroplastic-like [Zingiber officinale]|uniref:Pentatricopeptide repeat-containing protein-mitochondrial domain-containing protein n=1 Tax=Zingiber officinale TaxID=94328 RepID=A0A8J5GMK2_ZINOF|nr:pentatricopeptide repeat-containing protein CRP1 homolog, chloroplastic-like [Zingiber officinale]KAG6506965.1 hypothetical protein ZIOFF_032299 [Zingiber officinale]
MRSLLFSRLRPNARLLLSRIAFVSFTQSTHSPLLPLTPTRSLHGQSFAAGSSQTVESDPSRIIQIATPQAEDEEDSALNEFLSRFVWAIRPTINDAYPDLPKETVNSMLLVICQKVAALMDSTAAVEGSPVELSEDLWKTVVEVSNSVQQAMQRDRMREDLKKYIHSEEVKEMCRFAADIGIRGPMLRELRFKWARDKLEEVKFYQSLDKMREQAQEQEEREKRALLTSGSDEQHTSLAKENDAESKVTSLPQRKGKIKFKIYGLDLSHPKWAEVAEKAAEIDEGYVPGEPREPLQPVDGKCKKVEDSILSLNVKRDDPAPLLEEWKELLRPRRDDWLALLDRIKEKNAVLYMKVAELLLNEESFEANVRDYSKLIDAYAKEDRVEDAERLLKLMAERDIKPDVIISLILLHMYSKQGNLDAAKEAFESMKSEGFKPDSKTYSSMISVYLKANLPRTAEKLVRQMETMNVKPTKEMYMELLKAFAERGETDGAQRMTTTMQLSGIQPTLESFTLLVEAYRQANDPDNARSHFDHMMNSGYKPDDQCTASMIAAYAKQNLLDKALDLLLTLEKDGFQLGIKTYTVLVDWFGKLQLVQEAEATLQKITEKGDAPFEVHVSLCDMYSRAKIESKALRHLKVLVARKELLQADQYDRIISALIAGRLLEDAKSMHAQMQSKGYKLSEATATALRAAQSMPPYKTPPARGGKP